MLIKVSVQDVPWRSSSFSSTLKAANFCGSTPWRPRISMLAREKPHCGVSGVPFMNSTTGDEATALSMACRVASESNRIASGDRPRGCHFVADGRMARRKAWEAFSITAISASNLKGKNTGDLSVRRIMTVGVEVDGVEKSRCQALHHICLPLSLSVLRTTCSISTFCIDIPWTAFYSSSESRSNDFTLNA
jgi:hypothetical protein